MLLVDFLLLALRLLCVLVWVVLLASCLFCVLVCNFLLVLSPQFGCRVSKKRVDFAVVGGGAVTLVLVLVLLPSSSIASSFKVVLAPFTLGTEKAPLSPRRLWNERMCPFATTSVRKSVHCNAFGISVSLCHVKRQPISFPLLPLPEMR